MSHSQLVFFIFITFINIAKADENQMSITLQAQGKVKFYLAGSGELVIDWGNGKIQSHTINENLYDWKKLVRYPRVYHRYTHRYRGKQSRTITITGENLTSLTINSSNVTSLDVSNNPKLRLLTVENNLLTNLDVSKNIDLVYLHCSGNQIDSLCFRNNIKLSDVDVSNNNMSSWALDKMFETFRDQPEWGTIWIGSNPGIHFANLCIAWNRGWIVCVHPSVRTVCINPNSDENKIRGINN